MSRESITVFMGIMRQIQISTADFTADTQAMSAEQLLSLPLVSTELLNTAEIAMYAVHAKHRVGIRRAIVYVTELQARQVEALEEIVGSIKTESEWLSSQLKQLENGHHSANNV